MTEALVTREPPAPAYYDVPMLKPPVWGWEIATYFFLGGLSTGAYLLARMAERFGGPRYRDVTRAGTMVAWTTMLPCAPLLIKDLGDHKRFHYMLRVFKPGSPMNLGAWALTGYGGIVTLAALDELFERSGPTGEDVRNPGRLIGSSAHRLIGLLSDAAGIPLALLVAGYTGVLLSTTATPIWARNPWIGPLFSTGALSTGASAIHLLLAAGKPQEEQQRTEQADTIETIEQVTHVAEAATVAGFLSAAGSLAKPLTSGPYAPHLWGGAVGAGMIAPAIAQAAGRKFRRAAPWLKVTAAVLGLVGGLALRWALVYAGHTSAGDPQADRDVSRA